jgi:uncharacterized repeat protein (TIGR01451 family)
VTVSAKNQYDEDPVSDYDTHSVDILRTAVSITKTGPTYAHDYDVITYTINVSNDGEVDLYITYLYDTVLGNLSGYISDGVITVAEGYETFDVTHTVQPTPDPLPNTVTVDGENQFGEDPRTDSASHTVDILHPEIQVTKSADKVEAHEGDPVTYTIIVTNVGDCPLYDVTVIDDVLGNLTGYLPDDTLLVNESNTIIVTHTVPTPSDDITNIVTARGEDALGLEVTDTDSWTVDVLHPAINIVKTGPLYVRLGETITYTYVVTNVGDCPLKEITLTDDKVSPVNYVSGDTNNDGWLNLTETWTYTASWVVPSYGLVTNTATVTGKDNLDLLVSDQDSWTVRVMPKSKVTDSGLCDFDRDEDLDGRQFRLIFTQDPKSPGTFKLTASNPGQFYFNVFYYGEAGEEVTMDITIPYPFITHGATPIHVYSNVTYGEGGCFVPLNELQNFTITGTDTVTPSGELGIALSDYDGGEFVTITVTGDAPVSELIYVTIHLDYGLKHTLGYGKSGDDDAINPVNETVLISNLHNYNFSVNHDMKDWDIVQNQNTFKRNPGFGGIVTDSFGTPIEGYTVKVYDSEGNLIGSKMTDEDGFYFIYYKHKGKREIFDVKLYDDSNAFVELIAIELKANKFAEVNFIVP